MTDKAHLEVVHQTLLTEFADRPWHAVLDTLSVTGVADSQQLQRTTGLSRDKFIRLIEQLQVIVPESMFPQLTAQFRAPAHRGHPPKIFRLGGVGAAILRLTGHPDARPCELKADTPISHAVGMLDVYQAATQAGLKIEVDRERRSAMTAGCVPTQ